MNEAAARLRAGDEFKRADYNNDYLAEWSVRTSSPYGSEGPIKVLL